MRTSQKAAATLLAFFFVINSSPAQFQPALPGYRFEFPRDYFCHPGYQTEWWYYTGNLHTPDGRSFGFELTFFRQGVTRDPAKESPWDVRDLYFAHFAVSDLDGKRFYRAERTNRSGPGIAGADASQQKVWNGNWSVVWENGKENLQAHNGQFAIRLSLHSEKPPVIHGENGISRKSDGPGRASHYFSETRLSASGKLQIAESTLQVTGLAWMDHEFFTQQLDPGQAGWDWLSIQLADNTELMLFHLRRTDGSIDPFSAGTFIDAQGRSRQLASTDFSLEPSGSTWTSPATHATYPVQWRVRVPSLHLNLEVATSLPSQEMVSSSSSIPSYWEGAITIRGLKDSAPSTGSGYLEMTGYDRPVSYR